MPGLIVGVGWAYCLLVALIDLRVRRVPDWLTLPAILAALVYHAVAAPEALPGALLGGALAGGLFGAVGWLRPGGLGGGDVKLALLFGLIFGFPRIFLVLLVGAGAGAVVALGLLARGRAARSTIPYAPFLCLGAIVAMIS